MLLLRVDTSCERFTTGNLYSVSEFVLVNTVEETTASTNRKEAELSKHSQVKNGSRVRRLWFSHAGGSKRCKKKHAPFKYANSFNRSTSGLLTQAEDASSLTTNRERVQMRRVHLLLLLLQLPKQGVMLYSSYGRCSQTSLIMFFWA